MLVGCHFDRIVRRLYSRIRFPIPKHTGIGNAERIPYLPHHTRVTDHSLSLPRMAHRHAVLHAQPLIAATVQHIARKTERNARRLYQPVGRGHTVVEETLPKPQFVDIGEKLGILVGRTARETGIAVQVDDAAGLDTLHCPAHPLENVAAKRDIIQIDAVYIHRLYHPSQALYIVVVPARIAFGSQYGCIGHNSRLVLMVKMLIPLWGIPSDKMLAEPREATAVATTQYLGTKTSDGPYLGSGIAQFAQGIIEFHLQSFLVPCTGKILQFVDRQEGVVDKRMKLVGMVYVDDFHPCRHIGIRRHGFAAIVIIAVGKLSVQVDGLHRRDEQCKIKRYGLACLQHTLTAIDGHAGMLLAFVQTEPSLASIVPTFRIRRSVGIEQRSCIGASPQLTVYAGMGVAHPEAVEGP